MCEEHAGGLLGAEIRHKVHFFDLNFVRSLFLQQLSASLLLLLQFLLVLFSLF